MQEVTILTSTWLEVQRTLTEIRCTFAPPDAMALIQRSTILDTLIVRLYNQGVV